MTAKLILIIVLLPVVFILLNYEKILSWYAGYLSLRAARREAIEREAEVDKLISEAATANDMFNMSISQSLTRLLEVDTGKLELTFDRRNYLVLQDGKAWWEVRGLPFTVDPQKSLPELQIACEEARVAYEEEEAQYEWVEEEIPIIGSRRPGRHWVKRRKEERC